MRNAVSKGPLKKENKVLKKVKKVKKMFKIFFKLKKFYKKC